MAAGKIDSVERQDEKELDLLHVVRMAWAATRRHKLVAVLFPLLAVCLAATYTSYQTPLYRAKASAFLQDKSRQLIKDYEVGYYYLTREVMEAQKILAGTGRVVERAAKFALATGQTGEETEGELSRWLNESSVGIEGQLVVFSAIHPEPKVAAVLANAWCKAFVHEMTERERAGEVYTRDFLSSELPALRKAWIDKQDELMKFQAETSFDPRDLVNHPTIRRYNELTVKINEMETRRVELRNDLAQWNQHKEDVEALLQMPLTQADPQLADLEKALREHRLKLMRARLQFAVGSPVLLELENDVKLLEAQARDNLAAMRKRLGLELERLESNLAEFGRLREVTEKEYAHLKSQEARHRVLSSEFEQARRQYDELAKDQSTVDVIGRINFSSVQDWEPAVVPDRYFYPSWRKNLILGFLLGAMFSAALIFVLERLDTTITSTADLKEHLGVSVLGTFPLMARRELAGGGYFLARDRPELGILEQLKVVRNSLTVSRPQANGHGGFVVLVTSAWEGEGKSLITNNLATLFAQSGWRTLLIDLDVRKSTLSRVWDAPAGSGLQSILRGVGLQDCVCATSQPNLDLLSSRGLESAAEVVESEVLEKLLEEARKSYAVIIIDSAPVLLVADAFHVVRHCDTSLVVVRSRLTKKENVIQTLEILHRAQVRETAFILNGLNRMDSAGSGYGHGYGYDYRYGGQYGSREKEKGEGSE
jgi:capsular exopolysaccharide synthesis family protein